MSQESHVDKNKLLDDMAKDYASYFQVDATADKARLDRELEVMLTRLEECGSLLDRTRTENRHALDTLVPQIYSSYQTMQQTFQTIDQLELLVGRVKEDLTKMEKAVAQAESQLGASQSFTTVIKPFFFMREHIPERATSQLTFDPPAVFRAEDYFSEATETPSSQPSKP